MLALPGYGQQKPVARLPDTAMQQHYDAAYRLQDAGKPAQADAEHRLFLAAALHRIANGRANLGQYDRAKPVYEDALPFAPDEIALQIDYATAAVDAGDWANATMLAQRALHGLSAQSGQVRANATLLLAQALWGAGKQRESLEQFKAAAVLKPDFGTRYALARTYLALAEKANAVRVFEQLVASQGDSAALHMRFGRAYALADLFPEAVEEFKTAIAKDSKFPGVHYSLGAAYMQLYAEQGYPQAEVEFRRELALYPNDTFTYPQLGVIAVSQHKLTEAEADFKRALQLNPALPGTYFALGKLYTSLGRNAEAEAALRRAIAETIDPSKDDYQGQRIHYALGRLLLEEGKRDEAKEQLKIAEDLLEQSRNEDASLMGRHAAAAAPLSKTHEAKPGERAIENEYERKVGPLIAASYNNLGVHAAIRGDYPAATGFFVKTAQWNPTLHGIDNNLGRAAFLAGDYRLASESLTRVVAAQPQDVEARTMLALSCYKMGAYGKTIEALKSMEGQLDARPPLALAYAESMFRAGDAKDGLARLERLAAMHPDAAAPHQSLGEAYASNGDFERSARELRVALQLDPGNATIRRSLAASLTGLGQSAEAMALLKQLTQSGSTDAAAYLQLGRLQLANGDVGAGIATLQTSARLAPDDVDCHQALAEAYRRNAQPDAAKQEQQVAETLQDKRGSGAAAADAETTAEHASQTAGQTP